MLDKIEFFVWRLVWKLHYHQSRLRFERMASWQAKEELARTRWSFLRHRLMTEPLRNSDYIGPMP